jgi:RNA polymerase sigma-70 factor (ECF subfamily)
MQKQNNLIDACKQNDAKAQMQLYDKYVKAMYNIALKYVQQTDVAEDVVQEAFIKAFKKIDTYNAQVAFGAWLKRIVINQAIDYLKKKKLNLVSIDNQVINLTNEPLNWEVDTNITIEKIKKSINELPIKYKIVLQLFLLEGYDHQEIAEILNISTAASRTQLSRGKNKLKKLLCHSDRVTKGTTKNLI